MQATATSAGSRMIGIYLIGFVILVAGVGGLGTAIAYAVRPTERKLTLIRPLSLAGILAALSESLIPPFVAFAFLAVAWLLVAVGLRRQV